MDAEEARSIGARARMIRRRRGLSLEVVAGLAGITAGYLSMLERGLRGFNRRGLLEDLANALGCAVADLTGQPYLPPDRGTADALAVIAESTHDGQACDGHGPDRQRCAMSWYLRSLGDHDTHRGAITGACSRCAASSLSRALGRRRVDGRLTPASVLAARAS